MNVDTQTIVKICIDEPKNNKKMDWELKFGCGGARAIHFKKCSIMGPNCIRSLGIPHEKEKMKAGITKISTLLIHTAFCYT